MNPLEMKWEVKQIDYDDYKINSIQTITSSLQPWYVCVIDTYIGDDRTGLLTAEHIVDLHNKSLGL